MASPLIDSAGELLKRTTSRCPVCWAPCPGEVWRTQEQPSKVYLQRTCPRHGEFSACLASDARFYWLAQGNRANSGCCGTGSAAVSGASCCSADGSSVGTLGRNA